MCLGYVNNNRPQTNCQEILKRLLQKFLKTFRFLRINQTTSCEMSKTPRGKSSFCTRWCWARSLETTEPAERPFWFALSQLIHSSSTSLLRSRQHRAPRLPVALHPVVKCQLLHQISTYLKWRTLRFHSNHIMTELGRIKMHLLLLWSHQERSLLVFFNKNVSVTKVSPVNVTV